MRPIIFTRARRGGGCVGLHPGEFGFAVNVEGGARSFAGTAEVEEIGGGEGGGELGGGLVTVNTLEFVGHGLNRLRLER